MEDYELEASSLFSAGNIHFQKKEYEKAESYYTLAIELTKRQCELDPNKKENAAVFSNRAAARCRLQKWELALEDCYQTISIKPTWAKGYYRLALVFHTRQHGIAEVNDSNVEDSDLFRSYKAIAMAWALEPKVQLYENMNDGIKKELKEKISAESFQAIVDEVNSLLPSEAMALSGRSLDSSAKSQRQVPVTVLSGFLGSGKTTLLQRILHNRKGLRVAVIVNDMSVVNIDGALLKENQIVTSEEEQIIELSNGCICCTLKEDLLHKVAELCTSNSGKIDYILIESTGISEPLPVAQTFLYEDIYGRSLQNVSKLDTMVTVVDMSTFLENFQSLDNVKMKGWNATNTDERSIVNLLVDQIEFANVVVLNKSDLVREENNKFFNTESGQNKPSVESIKEMIQFLNPKAEVIVTSFCSFPIEKVMGTGLFDFKKAATAPKWFQELVSPHTAETEEYGFESWVYETNVQFDHRKVKQLLGDEQLNKMSKEVNLLTDFNVIRSKGSIVFQLRGKFEWASAGKQFTLRDSHMSKRSQAEAKSDTLGISKPERKSETTQIVFIGINMKQKKLESFLHSMTCD